MPEQNALFKLKKALWITAPVIYQMFVYRRFNRDQSLDFLGSKVPKNSSSISPIA